GAFHLDVSERRLLRGDVEVSLTPEGFELLRLLVCNAGRLVTRQEVLAHLWPDVVVEDGNVHKGVFLLRRALALRDDRTDWIETVPRAGYRFGAAAAEPSRREPGSEGEAPVTVAVLPFADLSPAADMRWLCDGIREQILVVLGRRPDLRVIARASSDRARGEELDLSRIGHELGATHVLEGSARNAGGLLRVTLRLSCCR